MFQPPFVNIIDPTATRLRAVDNGLVYLGKKGTDPTIQANQIPVYYIDENGKTQQLSQPIQLNGSGVPVLSKSSGTVINPVFYADVVSIVIQYKSEKTCYSDKSYPALNNYFSHLFSAAGYSYQGEWSPNIQIPAKADRVDGYALWEPASGRIVVPIKDEAFTTGYTFQNDLSSGKFIILSISNKTLTPEDFGAIGDGVTDDTIAIQLAYNIGKSVEFGHGKTYAVTSLTLSGSGVSVNGNNATLLMIPGTSKDIITVSGNFNTIHNLVVNGNGQTTDGNDSSKSYGAINLTGYGNLVDQCKAHSCGELWTSGDQGGTNQTGYGFGGDTANGLHPNIFRNCKSWGHRNYGFSIRSNVRIEGGSTYSNGTNGLGNRYAFNVVIRDLFVGNQRTDNPDTVTNGIYLDQETSGANVGKLSRNILLDNVTIVAQEGHSLTSSFWTDMTIQNCDIQGSIIVQSTIPSKAPDLGVTAEVKFFNTKVGRAASFLNHQRLTLKDCNFKSPDVLGLNIDNVDDFLKIANCVSQASITQIVRTGVTNIDDLTWYAKLNVSQGEGYISIENSHCFYPSKSQDAIGIDGGSNMSITNCFFRNAACAINAISGASNTRVIGNEFEFCGNATDGSVQNRVIRAVNVSGWTITNNTFITTSGGIIYASQLKKSVISNNIATTGDSTFYVAGSSDEFVIIGNNLTGSGTWTVFGGSTGDVVDNNYAGSMTIAGNRPPIKP